MWCVPSLRGSHVPASHTSVYCNMTTFREEGQSENQSPAAFATSLQDSPAVPRDSVYVRNMSSRPQHRPVWDRPEWQGMHPSCCPVAWSSSVVSSRCADAEMQSFATRRNGMGQPGRVGAAAASACRLRAVSALHRELLFHNQEKTTSVS